MNAEKVYEIGKQRCERESGIYKNTLIVNESIISNYIQSANFKFTYLNNNEFSFSIPVGMNDAVEYSHSPNQGLIHCDLVVVTGKIEQYGYLINHLDRTNPTGDIFYSHNDYVKAFNANLYKERSEKQQRQREQEKQEAIGAAKERYIEDQANKHNKIKQIKEEYFFEIEKLKEEHGFTDEEAIDYIISQYDL